MEQQSTVTDHNQEEYKVAFRQHTLRSWRQVLGAHMVGGLAASRWGIALAGFYHAWRPPERAAGRDHNLIEYSCKKLAFDGPSLQVQPWRSK